MGGVLKIQNPSIDDHTAALYVMFGAPIDELWARFTYREDLSGAGQQVLGVLGFTEWVTDQAYYGDWWRTGGIAGITEGLSAQAFTEQWNTTGTDDGDTAGASITGPGSGAEVYDLRGLRVSDGVFDTEIWHNGVLKWRERHHCTADLGHGPFTSFQALVIPNQFGGSTIYLDDISAGTTRGATDLLAVQTFDDLTFGAFTLDPGDMGSSVDSYLAITDPAGGGGPTAGRYMWVRI